MLSSIYLVQLAALFASVNAHGVILAAQGDPSSPVSIGMGVELSMPRNCTLVSPCQLDSPILRQAEMDAGMVDQCGRTQLAGDIPIATTAKDMASMNAVTKVTKGGSLVMTIHQINADGAGPYQCDLDQTGNGTSFMGNLPVTNNIPGANGLSQVSKTDFNITIAMPADMACNGGSTKDLCIVRCRNAALAGPFGGCVVVEQGDKTAA